MTKENKEYRLEDGSVITASSSSDFVTKLRESSMFDSDSTDQEYMVNFAARMEVQSGAIIRTDNPDIFVKDLTDVGFIE